MMRRVYIIEDDPGVSRLLRTWLDSTNLTSFFFRSAEEFIDAYVDDDNDPAPRCLVLDVFLPGISGLELQLELRKRGIELPILIVTGDSTVPMTVSAVKLGAFDVIEKPLRRQQFLELISRAMEHDQRCRPLMINKRSVERRLTQLTPREHEVLELLLRGKSNKKVAYELGITTQMASKHSAHIVAKLQISNLVELSQLLGNTDGSGNAVPEDASGRDPANWQHA